MFRLLIALTAVMTLSLGVCIPSTYAAEAEKTPGETVTPPADVATPPADVEAPGKAKTEDEEDTSGGESDSEEETKPE